MYRYINKEQFKNPADFILKKRIVHIYFNSFLQISVINAIPHHGMSGPNQAEVFLFDIF